MTDYYAKRLQAFQKEMKCDAAIFFSEEYNSNVFYFTGFKGVGVLIVFKNKKPVFLTSALDASRVRNKSLSIVVLQKSLSEYIKQYVPKKKTLGLDFATLPVLYFNLIKKAASAKKIIDVSQQLLIQRSIKDAYELEQLTIACEETCDILSLCFEKMHTFKTEAEVRNFLDSETKRRGYDVGYDTIVASGKNAANPHYSSCADKLHKGFLVIDFGVMVNGYHADVSRTVYLGKPTQKEIDAYAQVLSVQERCIAMLEHDCVVSEAQKYALKVLGKKYIHSLGHGIGLDIHELPNLHSKSEFKMKSGMTFTVEPGVYVKNAYGIRIEDDLLKMGSMLHNLTPLAKELIVIDTKIYK